MDFTDAKATLLHPMVKTISSTNQSCLRNEVSKELSFNPSRIKYKSYYFDLDLQHNQEQSYTQFFKFILNNSWFATFMGIKTIKLFFKQVYS